MAGTTPISVVILEDKLSVCHPAVTARQGGSYRHPCDSRRVTEEPAPTHMFAQAKSPRTYAQKVVPIRRMSCRASGYEGSQLPQRQKA